MLNVACVMVGNYGGRGAEYVEILYSGVRRNLPQGLPGRFVCFTDDPAALAHLAGVEIKTLPPGLNGWWNKLALFARGAFPEGERVLYFDLDTVITGPLDEIVAYDGPFALLHDAYRRHGYQSSVMSWRAGHGDAGLWEIFGSLRRAGRAEMKGGDQAFLECYLEAVDFWQDLYPGKFRSYKVDCRDFVPKGTSVVFFHGYPRPHEAQGWVEEAWRIGGPLAFALNTQEERIRANIRHALTKPDWIQMCDGIQAPAIIVGGGPSLANDLWRIRGWQLGGGVVFATNNTYRYLTENGIRPDAHVMHDARPQNLEFVPEGETVCYYASQCDPAVLDAGGDRLRCWHPHSQTCLDEIGSDPHGRYMVSGGSTVGLNAMSLAYILGHRRFLIFGFDSSYIDGAHHAYAQQLNDGEAVIEAEVAGERFICAPWMFQQAEQFMGLANQLTSFGCEIDVYGTGLLPAMMRHAEPVETAADQRARSILGWLDGMTNPVGAEIGVFAGELSRRLLTRSDLTLYLVDSWSTTHRPQYAASGDFHATLTAQQQEHFYRMTQHMVNFAKDRVRIVRADSTEAAASIPDESLDFVFIDADHTYEGCKADIAAWLPKVRVGGFISGHDYAHPEYPDWGVQRAVDEYFGSPELGENYTWKVQRRKYGSDGAA